MNLHIRLNFNFHEAYKYYTILNIGGYNGLSFVLKQFISFIIDITSHVFYLMFLVLEFQYFHAER